jgi:hypothetical protein
LGCDTCTIEPTISIVLRTGMAAIGLSILLLLAVLGLRLRLRVAEGRRERLLASWRPLFAACTADPFAARSELPLLRGCADTLTFQHLWVYMHESLQGEAKDNLNQLARLTGMDQAARRQLKKGNLRARLLAIMALGHLRERSAWEELRQIASLDHRDLSLAAADALVRIDAAEAMAFLSPLIRTRTDWSPPRVARLLMEAECFSTSSMPHSTSLSSISRG